MTKLLLPLPEIKRYVKALKKSPNNTLNHTQLTDVVVKALGHEDLRDYKFRSKNEKSFEATYQAVDRLSLDKLVEWRQAFYDELKRHGIEAGCCHCIFDKYVQFQLKGLPEMSALRISGLLFLMSYLSPKPFFDTQTLALDTDGMLSYLRTEKLTQSVKVRLADYAEKNRLTQSRYHEGVFSNLLGMWGQGSLSDERFAKEVQALLVEEIDYIGRFSVGHFDPPKKVSFTFPIAHRDDDRPSNTEFLQRVRSAVHLNSPLLLGYESCEASSMPFKGGSQPSKNLLLTNSEIKENILITGVAGSGRVRIGLGVVHQAINAGSGCVFIDGAGNLHCYALIASMAKSVGRQDDVIFYSINHNSLFESNEIQRLISANKIVVLCLPSLEKDPEVFLPILKGLMIALKVAMSSIDRKKMSQYFPYLIVLCDTLRVWRVDEQNLFPEMIRKANKANLGVVAIDEEIDIFEKVIESGCFKHQMIMKQCELPDSVNLGDLNIRDIIQLTPGEFVYKKMGERKAEKHKIYRGPYSDPIFEDLYLVMS